MPASIASVTDATFEAEVELSKGLTLVDFSATWCPPCRLIEPILNEIATERHGVVKVVKVDTDENMRTTIRFNVRSAPTVLFFKEGQLVDRIVGAVPKARIDAVIDKYGTANGAGLSSPNAIREKKITGQGVVHTASSG